MLNCTYLIDFSSKNKINVINFYLGGIISPYAIVDHLKTQMLHIVNE